MQATALICDEAQQFWLETVTLPEPQPDEIVIRTAFSGVSIGTEFALIRKKLIWQPFPLCTGYMATGVIESVGKDVQNFTIGDRVFVRGNRQMNLLDGTKVGSVEGAHCSYIIRKPNDLEGCGLVPAAADMAVASMYVMPAVALNGLAQAQPEATETVLVYGAGLIGLSVVGLAALRGCEVIAVDINDRQLALAKQMGADHVINAAKTDWRDQLKVIVPNGADVVFEATGIPTCVDTALSLCRNRGKFVWQGNYGREALAYNFLAAHGRQLRAFYPCHDGQLPFRQKVLKLIASGALPWHHCITHRIAYQDAPAMFERINQGDKDVVGVVIDWDQAA